MPSPSSAPSLKDTLSTRYGISNYRVGAAIDTTQTSGISRTLLLKHFSSITAEYQMKPDVIWPNAPGTSGATAMPAGAPSYTAGDALASFATANQINLRCHALVWHQTAPDWFFAGDPVNDAVNYRITVQQRLRNYIRAVVAHYPTCYAWDVVNEVATDTPNAANPYRTTSPWYIAYSAGGADGSQYVKDAFQFAFEARRDLLGQTAADMKLMLNDYNTEIPGKRANVLKIVQELIASGVPIDGVGHQFHLQLGTDVTQVTAALAAFENLGVALDNHVTELDVSVYADPGTCFSSRTIPPCAADYGANPPQSALSQQATTYRALFNAFNRPSVTSITTWGVLDSHTWLNTFPVNRTNRPLLFDTAGDPKWAFWAVVDPNLVIP